MGSWRSLLDLTIRGAKILKMSPASWTVVCDDGPFCVIFNVGTKAWQRLSCVFCRSRAFLFRTLTSAISVRLLWAPANYLHFWTLMFLFLLFLLWLPSQNRTDLGCQVRADTDPRFQAVLKIVFLVYPLQEPLMLRPLKVWISSSVPVSN